MALVTLSEVNNALKLDLDIDADPSENQDMGRIDDIEAKIAQAEDIVLDYIKHPEGSEDWDEDTVPGRVKAAVILVVGALMGDDEKQTEMLSGLQGGEVTLANPIVALLYRLRDPALA